MIGSRGPEFGAALRALAPRGLLALLLLVGAFLFVCPAPAEAKQCPYCLQEIDDNVNELRCPHCNEIAQKIARGVELKGNPDEENAHIWVLDFQPGKLKKIQIKDDTGDVETFWILPYTLRNKDEIPHEFFIDMLAYSDQVRHPHKAGTESDMFFVPSPRQASETLQGPSAERPLEPPHDWSRGPGPQLKGSARYHDTWVPDAYEEARKVLGKREGQQLLSQRELCMPPEGKTNVQPKLKDINTRDTARIALPTIQPGEELQCVAIFPSMDAEMDALSVMVRGLTNSSLLTHSDFVRPPDRPHERVVTEAVLVLTWRRPGDEFAPDLDPIEFVGRRWTDQTRTVKNDLKSLPSDTLTDND